jgi:acyl-CoA synthetase (NDP forming)
MKPFLNPDSVVLIGVTRNEGTGAYNNLEVMLNFGVSATIYVVHPKMESILGYPAYTSVMDIPIMPIDLAHKARVPFSPTYYALQSCPSVGFQFKWTLII